MPNYNCLYIGVGVGAIAEGGWQMWVIIPQVDTQT